MIFPEDADIRIPPEPAKSCSAKLEVKQNHTEVNMFCFYFSVEKIRSVLQTF
jgi:hypothetical protein